MGVVVDVERCENPAELMRTDEWGDADQVGEVALALALLMQVVGVDELTATNTGARGRFRTRVRQLEDSGVYGWTAQGLGVSLLDPGTLARYVGLRTNANRLSPSEWLLKLTAVVASPARVRRDWGGTMVVRRVGSGADATTAAVIASADLVMRSEAFGYELGLAVVEGGARIVPYTPAVDPRGDWRADAVEDRG